MHKINKDRGPRQMENGQDNAGFDESLDNIDKVISRYEWQYLLDDDINIVIIYC